MVAAGRACPDRPKPIKSAATQRWPAAVRMGIIFFDRDNTTSVRRAVRDRRGTSQSSFQIVHAEAVDLQVMGLKRKIGRIGEACFGSSQNSRLDRAGRWIEIAHRCLLKCGLNIGMKSDFKGVERTILQAQVGDEWTSRRRCLSLRMSVCTRFSGNCGLADFRLVRQFSSAA